MFFIDFYSNLYNIGFVKDNLIETIKIYGRK